jgi:hypothetical protein
LKGGTLIKSNENLKVRVEGERKQLEKCEELVDTLSIYIEIAWEYIARYEPSMIY